MSKFEIVELERPATGGAVGRISDGRVAFVRGGLPGETVRVELSSEGAKFVRGDAIEVIRTHPNRVECPCPHAGAHHCGGCDLQHADVATQLYWKAYLVHEHLQRIGRIDRAVTVQSTSSMAKGSRTRVRCAVNEDGELCFRRSRSRELEKISACWLADARLEGAHRTNWNGFVEVELRAIGGGEPFAVGRTPKGHFVVCSLSGHTMEVAPVSHVVVNDDGYVVSPRSFWQSHVDAPHVLSETVAKFADGEKWNRVVDLYAGVGLFARQFARRGIETICVESSDSSVHDARHNLHGLPAVVHQGWIDREYVQGLLRPNDLVVVDPPRKGLAPGTAMALAQSGVGRIIYISCDAATFARDVHEFTDSGFILSDLEVFDLFPMTEHVELVGLLDAG